MQAGASPEPRRLAGVLVPLPAIRAERDAGIGELFDLLPFVDWVAGAGMRLVSLLPLGELAPGEASPYNALSTFAIDPLHLTLAGVPELAGVAAAAEPPASVAMPRLDRERVRAWKAPLLDEAFARFRRLPEGCARRRAYRAFASANLHWLDDHALFRALYEEQGRRAWSDWPEPLRRRDPDALGDAVERLAPAIGRERYLQFAAQEQWWRVREHARSRGVLVMGDLPFAPSGNSADVWANQGFFDPARSVGAPPDDFSATGQKWGLPMYRWSRLRADDWRWFRARFRRMADLYDLHRIDHVVGLFRTYAFDEGGSGRFDPAAEAEQRAQGRELLEIALAESGAAGVVAEDLGTIPPFVRRCMAELDVPGYKVLRWEREADGFVDPRRYPECSIATTGTHDTEPLGPWWSALDPLERLSLASLVEESGGAEPPASEPGGEAVGPAPEALDDDLRWKLLGLLYESPARHVILPVQDLFGWEERINLPGSVGPGNWTVRWRLPPGDSASAGTARRLAALSRASGRGGA